ncbi:MAG: hypothetical protein ACR2PS_05585 [Pseudomonadales bacterium]
MSVLLHTLKDPEQVSVEVWAPDYSVANVWLIYEDDESDDSRVDLSLDQLRQLRDVANGIFGD